MVRVYDTKSTCSSCHEHGQFGWLYQCTQDRDKIIKEKLSCMDYLDYCFRKDMGIRKGSEEARRDKLSFLDELTYEKMASYRPDQIATILRQREELKDVIAKEEFRSRSSALLANTRSNDNIYAGHWEAYEEQECPYKICPGCRPVCADRAFLSLNAVADGEIPPTAAAGFGFEPLGGRPVIEKDVVKSIGEHRARHLNQPHASNRRMMKMLHEQIARLLIHNRNEPLRNELEDTILAPRSPRQLPTVQNIAAAKQRIRKERQVLDRVAQHAEQETSVLKAPELLESPWPWLAALESSFVPDAREENQTRERSLRQRPRASRIPCPSTNSRSTRRRLADQLLFSTSNPWRVLVDVGNAETSLPLDLNNSRGTGSRETENGNNDEDLSSAPLRVDHGVAVTEESIEARVPDVVTQA
ncbi:hypothetical protein FSARC_8662 [Fusarium sarcochroum]|uniref:Uncharacterized protein n=1 Tax=Fusarium sarcochroum TaxID=1208366 RepID=A0A8H4X705_9HYPO|nr:hypothetical protein FSARC_8662 [Fusarium sarcochroum]